jgi:hypothetical protein
MGSGLGWADFEFEYGKKLTEENMTGRFVDLMAAADYMGRVRLKWNGTRRRFSTSCGGGGVRAADQAGAGDRTSLAVF